MVYAEIKDCKVESSAYELFTKAKELFPGEDVKFAFVALGKGIDAAVAELKESGADVVYAMDDEKLAVYNVDYYSIGVMGAVKEFDPDILLMPASMLGEELAPTLGLKLKTGVAAHCVDLCIREEDGAYVQMVPAFGGKVIGEILIPNTRPQIASIKPGNFTAVKQEAKDAEVVALDKAELAAFTSKIEVVEVVEEKVEGLPIEKADIVVCGGYGTGSQENWNNIEKLAALFGGAPGCTRPVIDEGWMPNEKNMVGTSGKTIRPKVYIGTGISGATHHLCGMKDSGVIICINNDADAEIFGSANYKVVGDGNKIVAELCAMLEK